MVLAPKSIFGRLRPPSVRKAVKDERTSPSRNPGGQHRSLIPEATYRSSMGPHPAATDCWVRLHGARFREAIKGAASIRRDTARPRRAGAASHGMDQHSDRTDRWFGGLARSLPPTR